MQNKRVIDASSGYYPTRRIQQQPQQQLNTYTVTVNPSANIMYEQPQPVQRVIPTRVVPPPVVSHEPVQKTVPPPVVSHEQPTLQPVGGDPSMKCFDLTGCKSMDEAYTKNAKHIKFSIE